MKKNALLKLTAIVLILALALAGCSKPDSDAPNTDPTPVESEQPSTPEAPTEPEVPTEVEITDIYGTVVVPVNPQRVVALDNRTFETLQDWGIQLVAAPKAIMPKDLVYVSDDSVADIGSHNEPNLEVLAAADPDLVIVGQRFAGRYDEIKALVPNAVVINLNFDVSTSAEHPGDNLVDGLKNSTLALGAIFNKNAEAAQLVADFDKSIADAKAAYNGTDTVISIVVSGGNIGYSAPRTGRVWGPMHEVFGWVSPLEVAGATSDHQGDDISVEAIAQGNPTWIFVLDRDAATAAAGESTPAIDVINNAPALQNVTAVKENKIVFAPADTYTNESIQTYVELFATIADALAGK